MGSISVQFVKWGTNLIMKSRSSFSRKTLFYFVGFSVTILLLLWLFQIIFLKYSYELYQVKNLNELVESIEASPLISLSSTLETVAYQNEVCVEYFTNSGQRLRYNTLMNGCALGKNNSDITSIENDFINSELPKKSYRLMNKEYEAKAFLYGLKMDSGTVFLYSTLEDVSGANVVLKNQLIYLTIIAILFASLIAFFLSKKLIEPILDITKKAKKLGSGTFVTFPSYDIEEVNDLANVLNQAGSEMLKTDELRRDLMANVSHDLKTPLTMIKAYAEMVKDLSYKDDQKREEHCNIIMNEVDRLNLLVNDILTLSKNEASAEELKIEKYDLVSEINEIIKHYEILKVTEDYHFDVKTPKKVMITGDKAKLNQVIYNLFNNAINYTGPDKLVTLKIIEDKEKYRIEIKDTGKGIDQKDLPNIWNKYYKNEKNHQRNVVGTGLGLAIVKTILEAHHFEYGVESKKGKGTTFYFCVEKL